jgi:hypothetical protein
VRAIHVGNFLSRAKRKGMKEGKEEERESLRLPKKVEQF